MTVGASIGPDIDKALPVPPGDPAGIDAAVGTLKMLAGDSGLHKLGNAFRAEGTNMAGSWQSPEAAAQATTAVSRLAGYSTDYGDRVGIAAQALHGFAEKLATTQQGARNLQARAREAADEADAEARRRNDPSVFKPLFTEALNKLAAEYQSMMAALDQAAKTCAQGVDSAIPGYSSSMNPSNAASIATKAVAAKLTITRADKLIELGGRGSDGRTPPTTQNDPKLTARWWAALTPEERAKLIADQHREVGNLGGIPAAARSQANEVSLAEDLKSSDPTLRDNAEHIKSALDKARTVDDPRNPGQKAGGQLLIYDPTRFDYDGRAAIAVGDVDTARHVMVQVPGITTNVDGLPDSKDGPGMVDSAKNLYTEARSGSADSSAVVVWMGYDAPSGSIPVLGYQTVTTGHAIEGGQLLADDMSGLRASHDQAYNDALAAGQPADPMHLTVIGHSYGSLTTGIAAGTDGMKADDIVLIGSPGTNADHAGELNDPRHVFVGAYHRDMVSYVGQVNRWGNDPTTYAYGGTRFAAEGDPKPWVNIPGNHTQYYQPGSDALYNIAKVGTGHPDQLRLEDRRPVPP